MRLAPLQRPQTDHVQIHPTFVSLAQAQAHMVDAPTAGLTYLTVYGLRTDEKRWNESAPGIDLSLATKTGRSSSAQPRSDMKDGMDRNLSSRAFCDVNAHQDRFPAPDMTSRMKGSQAVRQSGSQAVRQPGSQAVRQSGSLWLPRRMHIEPDGLQWSGQWKKLSTYTVCGAGMVDRRERQLLCESRCMSTRSATWFEVGSCVLPEPETHACRAPSLEHRPDRVSQSSTSLNEVRRSDTALAPDFFTTHLSLLNRRQTTLPSSAPTVRIFHLIARQQAGPPPVVTL
ncbi:hypothetical protein E2P81_ATG04151 [Venturia nashicola]|nr:hypothetical protein E2P81_ATG04151 [Venturia nashicola]